VSGKIRRAGPRDLDRVAALWTAIGAYHESLDPAFRMRPDAGDEIRELLRATVRDPHSALLVCDDEGDLQGLCIVRIDRAPPILEETRRGEITDLGVRESARRRGIGTRLVDEALAWLGEAGVARVQVQVAAPNAAAQAFWRARGFQNFMDVLHKRL